MDLTTLFQFAQDHGLAIAVILALLLVISYLFRQLIDEDQASLFRAKIYKSLLYFSKRREHEKKYIANDVKGKLNLARKRLHYGREILPKAVSVEWADGSDPKSYEIAEGQFVVCLDPAHRQEENIVHLAEVLIQRTSLIGIRHLIKESIRTALDNTLTRSLLYETKSTAPLNWFYFHILQPILKASGDLANWHTKVIEIDEQGLFNALLLIELEDFSRRIHGMQLRPYMVGEIEHLVNFVHRVATKEEGVDVPLEYCRAHLRVGIVLVARADTILDYGIERYIDAARYKVDHDNVNTLYLIMWEKKYLSIIRPDDFIRYNKRCQKLASQIEQLPRVSKDFEIKSYSYIDPHGRRRQGCLVRYVVNTR